MGGAFTATKVPGVRMRITPSVPQIKKPGDTVTYVADVAGTANKAVTWAATAGSPRTKTACFISSEIKSGPLTRSMRQCTRSIRI